MGTGRPTKYRPSFCKEVIRLGEQGKMPAQIAATLKVSKDALHKWAREYPEFGEAYLLAKEACEAFLLEKAIERAQGLNERGSDHMLKFLLAAGFGYREKSEQPIQIVTPQGNGQVEITLADMIPKQNP